MEETETNPPHYMQGNKHAIVSHFYLNGNKHFECKKVLINQKSHKTWDSILDQLTYSLKPPFGAVRSIYTPAHGHRVHNIEDFNPEAKYVAGGYGRFKCIPYTDIESRPRRPHRAKIDDQVIPVAHSRFRQISGRYRKIGGAGITILVHINGDFINPPKVVLLSNKEQHNWEGIINAVSEKVKFSICRPVEKLFSIEGEPITEPADLHHNHPYVAVALYDPFKRCHYGLGMPHIGTSPRLEKRLLPPIKRKYKSSQGTPESSVASNTDSVNTYGSRSRQVVGQGNNYFHAKSVKHKPTPPDNAKRNLNLDRDKDGVFKARNLNRATAGAREVQENQDTRVDLPIDQVEAEEVKTEMIGEDENKPKLDDRSNIKERDQRTRYRNRQKEADHGHGKKEARREVDLSQSQKEPKRAGNRPHYESPSPNQLSPVEKDHNTNNAAIHSTTPTSDTLFQSASLSPPKSSREQAGETPREKMQENEAATKIQANYRGYKARQEVDEIKKEKAADETLKDQQKIDTLDDSKLSASEQQRVERENEAATKIQASYRGHSVRKQIKEQQQQVRDDKEYQQVYDPTPSESDYASDREVRAATAIQSGYRGYQARKQVGNMKQNPEQNEAKQEQQHVEKDNTEEISQKQAAELIEAGYMGYQAREQVRHIKDEQKKDTAAVKIQAHYRGYKTRKELGQAVGSDIPEVQDDIAMPESLSGDKDLSKLSPEALDVDNKLSNPVSEPTQQEHDAATKIQSNFKGYIARKNLREEQEETTPDLAQ